MLRRKGSSDFRISPLSRIENNSDRSSEIDSMECFVYVLGNWRKDGYRTYVGWTTDLDRRLAEHNAGTGARSTRGRVWVLLYAEQHATRSEAMSREWHLKRDRQLRRRLACCWHTA
jgi:putative endonuclease